MCSKSIVDITPSKTAIFEKLRIYLFVEIFRLRVKIRKFLSNLLTLSIWAQTDINSWNESKKLFASFFPSCRIRSLFTIFHNYFLRRWVAKLKLNWLRKRLSWVFSEHSPVRKEGITGGDFHTSHYHINSTWRRDNYAKYDGKPADESSVIKLKNLGGAFFSKTISKKMTHHISRIQILLFSVNFEMKKRNYLSSQKKW